MKKFYILGVLSILSCVVLAVLYMPSEGDFARFVGDAGPTDANTTQANSRAKASSTPTSKNNGNVSLEALSAQLSKNFRSLDTDQSGRISQEEADRLFQVIRARTIEKSDLNKDGALDQKEFLADLVESFYKADTNHDGFLTPEELQASVQKTKGKNLRMEGFKKADLNKDNRLSLQELAQEPKRRFSLLDKDGDGKITTAEIDGTLQMRREKMFKNMDKDGDGGIDGQEFSAPVAQKFWKLDANHDGILTPQEAKGGGKTSVFGALDTNGDGALTLQEFTSHRLEGFSKADTNHDGRISQEEDKAPLRARRDGLFAQLDTDHNKRIDRKEFLAPSRAQFTKADTNKDGVLAREEVGIIVGKSEKSSDLLERAFQKQDANTDGTLSFEEFSELSEVSFNRFDTNRDGTITFEEVDTALGKPWKQAFDKMDINRDGVIDREEFLSSLKKKFSRLDGNNDGVLTSTEVQGRTEKAQRGDRR